MPARCPRFRLEPLEDRLTPAAGDLDPTFGVGGRAVVPFDTAGSGPSAPGVAALPNGEVVVAGSIYVPAVNHYEFAVARLTWSGAPDPTFGTGGQVVIDVAEGTSWASAVAVQSDGKVIAVGQAFATAEQPTSDVQFAIVRLNADGRLDPTFGIGGKALVPFDLGPSGASAVTVQPDGKVVVAGVVSLTPTAPNAPNSDFAVVRLNPDGSLDSTFGTSGRLTIPFDLGANDMSDSASAVLVQPDGKIVVAGSAGVSGSMNLHGFTSGSVFAAARLNPDGSLDGSFGVGGRVTVSFDPSASNRIDSVSSVVVQPNGKIVLAGTGSITSFPPGGSNPEVARLNPDGSLDGSFGVGGKAVLPVAGSTGEVALQHTGKIILAATVKQGQTNVAEVIRLEGEPVGPGAVLAGGRPDGAAVVLSPSAGPYVVADAFQFFPRFAGVVRTAAADVNGDGVPDFVGGPGPGGGPRVVVLDGKTGAKLADWFAFETSFAGGVLVAAADVTGDGRAEVVVTPDRGGGPVVAVYDGAKLAAGLTGDAAQVVRFFGIDDPAFRGGARPALGDVSGDGTPDLAVAAGFLGGPRVALFDGQSIIAGGPVKLVADFFAFEDTLRNGAFVAAGDVDGDGHADLTFGGGPGGAPRVRVFDGAALLTAGPFATLDQVAGAAQRANFFAGDASLRGGVRVLLRDADGDGRADLVTGSGEGEPSRVRVFQSPNLLANPAPSPDQELDPFGTTLADGVFVG